MHKGVFSYKCNKDGGVTGNLEISITRRGTPNKVQVVHEKKGKNQGFPHENWEAFHERLDAAIKAL